jgi:hypothetical protein
LETGTEKVEDPWVFTRGFVPWVRIRRSESGVDGETHRLDLVPWHAQSGESLGGWLVGNHPKICLSGGPKAMDRNRIGHHRDELKTFAKVPGQSGDEVGIHGEGQNDNLRLMNLDQLADAEVGWLVDED